ncbi:MAG: glycerol-3-phosphate acyltransferase [Gemmiger sp.]|nr:glycerol-3-phosphate acyltransferase [Gemmiger sp.]
MGLNTVALRLLCLLLGYLVGSFLTAEIVTRVVAGKSPRHIGSGNPGMANVMANLGWGAGLAVLAGDALKTALVVGLCQFEIGPYIGGAAALYAGLGGVLGHDFPFWRLKKGGGGGKGVTATCVWLMVYQPLWGTACCLLGAGVVLLTGYLPLGAVLIPALAVPFGFWWQGPESGAVLLASLLLMVNRHWHGLARMKAGTEKQFFRHHG